MKTSKEFEVIVCTNNMQNEFLLHYWTICPILERLEYHESNIRDVEKLQYLVLSVENCLPREVEYINLFLFPTHKSDKLASIGYSNGVIDST